MRRAINGINKWEWLIPLLLLPILLLPAGPIALFLLALPVLWLVRWLVTRHFLPQTPYDTTILALASMVLVSLFVVFDITLSFPKIAGIILSISLFYATISYTRQHADGLWRLLFFFLVAAVAMTFVSLMGAQWLPPFTFLNTTQKLLPLPTRIPGTTTGLINTNEIAGVLDWVVPILVALLVGLRRPLWQKRKFLLFLLSGMVAFSSTILMATRSRNGALAIAVSLLVMLAIARRWGRWVLLTAVLVAISFAFYFDLDSLFLGSSTAIDQLGLQGRIEIWSRALYGLADFPLTGMSMNAFRRLVHILYPLFLIAPDTDIGHAHNQLLQAGLDLGIPGLIAYLSLWLVTVALLWQSWRQAQEHGHRVLIIGLSGAMAASWMFGVFDAIALGARPGFMWWLLLAMVVSVHDSTKRKTRPD